MTSEGSSQGTEKVAFVLGGGGLRGAAEVGMIKALVGAGIRPDLVVGTSIGAINGAVIASGPLDVMADRLEGMWGELTSRGVLREGLFSRIANLARHRTYLHTNDAMRELLLDWLPITRFEDLAIPFQC